jgi:hypothetical protein
MQYLIMLHFRPGEGPQEGTPEFDAEMERWGEIKREMRAAGVMVGASGLDPTPPSCAAAPATRRGRTPPTRGRWH